jgi:glycogen debranching enzyme
LDDIIRVEDKWFVAATSSHADDRVRVLKDGETFGVFDRHGDIHPVGLGQQGLYHEGTRHLSREQLLVNGQRPLLLNSCVASQSSLLAVDLTTPDLYQEGRLQVRKDTLHVFRSKLLQEAVQYEHLRLTNYGDEVVTTTLDLLLGADFADIFEVRGIVRPRRGQLLPIEHGNEEILLRYAGLDGVERRTRVLLSEAPAAISEGSIRFEFALSPHESREIFLTLVCENGEARPPVAEYNAALHQARERLVRAAARTADVFSSNEQLNDWLNRSAADIHMLTTSTAQGAYPYAGVPWFSTAFGRDGIITALELLWIYPDLARGVLGFLAANQATEVDTEQDAEPGKILHETRHGEMATLREIPFGRYYGSVDSTPLFVQLAGAYYERTGDRPFIEALWPSVQRALGWIDHYGDVDGDGFVEYQRHAETGLVHQGWKDSADAVFHADGTPAPGPIALCEVQGYVYAARRAAARLADLIGEPARACELERQAEALKRRFNDAFWLDGLDTYALALDGRKQPCRVRSSNAGHALFSGIADAERAQRVVATLLEEASWSGWGVRTLAATERRFNPMSYHNGSVWPHDNALIAMGLATYGFKQEASRILTGLFDASIVMEFNRLPELFCGFRRLPGQGPILYPVACSPQAWASGAVYYLLQAVLGLQFSPAKPQLRFHHPQLPDYLHWLRLTNLRVGGAVVDLVFTRHKLDVSINVTRKDGDIEIAVIV